MMVSTGLLRPMAAALLAALALSGCGREQKAFYDVRGVVQEVRADAGEVVVDHEAIPGFMEAMTMTYRVADPALLKGIVLKERVIFRLAVTSSEAVIERIEPIPGGAPEKPRNAKPDNAALLHVPERGEIIPDAVLSSILTDQDGRRARLKDENGKVLVISFIYTRCPDPDFCPRAMGEFRALKTKLGDLVGKDIDFFSITFDPIHDSPGVLKSYGSAYGAGVPSWRLLTGRPATIKKLASFFDVAYWTTPEGRIREHSMSIAIVDRSGRMAGFYTGTHYDAEEIARVVREAVKQSL